MRPAPCKLIPAILGLSAFLSGCSREPAPPTVVIEAEPTISAVINTLLDGGGSYRDVPFSEVIEASSGKRVIPLDPNDELDAQIVDEISLALDKCLVDFNQPESEIRRKSRISDAGALFQKKFEALMNAAPGFSCERPRNRQGNLQRSGYPDLRLVHRESGRVIYLVPKLVEENSLNSSLQTFYFTPRGDAGKVLDDAHHLVIGIEHDGRSGDWSFPRWLLVDLANFRVRLKAEFQASNKDLYMSELVIRKSRKVSQ